MSTNDHFKRAVDRSVIATQPATPVSGDPVLVNDMPGVCTVSEGPDGRCSATFEGAWDLPVKGIDGAGNSAVAENDKLYYTAGDTPPISKKATGTFFGYAYGTVGSSATATIPVVLARV
jgi:hypothetical protein